MTEHIEPGKKHELKQLPRPTTGSKYHRRLVGRNGGVAITDVYRVLIAFNVTDPGCQHAIKKLLCAGIREKGSKIQDLREAVDAIEESILIELREIGEANDNKLPGWSLPLK